MNLNLLKTFVERDEFISHLENDINKNEAIITEARKSKDELNVVIKNLNDLGLYPEKEALIPLSKNIYMKGNIVHTGEYHIQRVSHPDSYIFLNTLNQTIHSLEAQVTSIEGDISKANYANDQLIERMKLLKGDDNEKSPDGDNLPKEIKSEKGVAVRVGDYYEILEFED